MSIAEHESEQGSWSSIFLIYAIGVLGAMTISQAIPVIGQLVGRFHAGAQAGWIISSPSVLVAIGALGAGWIVDRVGDKAVLVTSCAIVVAGDIGAALAFDFQTLMAMRIVEGIGYVGIAVAAITMMTRITHGPRRNIALTLWSSFIPLSFALPFLAAVGLARAGWQWAFLGHGFALAALLIVALFRLPGRGKERAPSRTAGLIAVLRSPWPYLLGLSFACAAFVQTGIVSTLPQLLSAKYSVGIAAASSVGTVGMVVNTIGCLMVGPLLNRGVRPQGIALGGVALTIGAGLALGLALPGFAVAVLVSCIFFFGAGVIVGLWALLPQVAPDRQSLGATSGLVTQVTLLGVLFGPPAAFAAEAAGGWAHEGCNIVVGGLVILVCIWLVARKFARSGSQSALGVATH